MPSIAAPTTSTPVAVVRNQRIGALALVNSLFFLWAIGVHFNDILIPHFKGVFHLNDFESSFIQTAFFGGYFLAAIPAGKISERFGYKRGMITGLLICAAGAVMFMASARASYFPLFLGSLFVMACGQSFLEVSANPYVALLGPAKTSAMRLNIAQAVNAVGAVCTPILGARLILAPVEHAARSGQAASEWKILALPYFGLTAIYLIYASLIRLFNLPAIRHEYDAATEPVAVEAKYLARMPQVTFGVVAQFFYVGTQVGVASFIIRLAEHRIPGLEHSSAATFLQYHLIGFLAGRVLGAMLLRSVSPSKLLAVFAVTGVVAAVLVITGPSLTPVWAAVALGASNSIMFPTIFALAIANLGPYAKMAASWLVMAIIGGALLPSVMGLISDHSNIQFAFAVPLVSYVIVLAYAVFVMRRPTLVS